MKQNSAHGINPSKCSDNITMSRLCVIKNNLINTNVRVKKGFVQEQFKNV